MCSNFAVRGKRPGFFFDTAPRATNDMPSLTEVGEFLDKVGFFGAFMVAIGLACWYFSPLLKKFIESQIGLVETLREEQPKITAVLQKQAETDERHVATSERIATSQETANKMLEGIYAAVTKPTTRGRK